MGTDHSQQRFAEAKRLYGEGNYEKALLHLRKLDKKHPDVFNIQHPILQCLQHLGKMNEIKSLLERMLEIHHEEKKQAKLKRVGRWITRTEQNITPSKGYSKGGDIESDFGDEIEEVGKAIRERAQKEEHEAVSPDTDAISIQEPTTNMEQQNRKPTPKAIKKKHPVMRKILIAFEVAIVVLIGMAAMFLLSKQTTRTLPEFTADVIMEVNDTQITGKLYLKNADTFRMEIMEQTFIANSGQVRKILTEEEKYINVNPSDVERYNPLVGLSNFGDWVRINDAQKIGRETLDGFVCDIYEASVKGTDSTPSMSTKVWYCRKIKFPLKSENSAPELNGKFSVTLDNIKTEESLPSDKFDVPAVYAEFVKKKEKEPDPTKLDALPDNMEALLEAGDPTALLMQFQ